MAVGGRAGQSLGPCRQSGGAGGGARVPRTARQARAARPGQTAGSNEEGAGARGRPGPLPPLLAAGWAAAPGGSGAERGYFPSFRVACSRCSLRDSLSTGCCCNGCRQGLVSQALCTANPGRQLPGGEKRACWWRFPPPRLNSSSGRLWKQKDHSCSGVGYLVCRGEPMKRPASSGIPWLRRGKPDWQFTCLALLEPSHTTETNL